MKVEQAPGLHRSGIDDGLFALESWHAAAGEEAVVLKTTAHAAGPAQPG